MSAFKHLFSTLLPAFVAISAVSVASEALAQGTPPLSGIVRSATSGEPLAGVVIVAGHAAFQGFGYTFVVDGQATTNAAGAYEMATLNSAPGNQYIVHARRSDFVPVRYPDVICRFRCGGFSNNTPTVTAPASANFNLPPAGFISGQIRRESGSEAVQARVEISSANLSAVYWITTDQEGRFVFDSLLPDSYWVWADVEPSSGLVDQVHPSIGLDITRSFLSVVSSGLASPVPVAAGQTVDMQFGLQRAACIEGQRMSSLTGQSQDVAVSIRRVQTPPSAGFVQAAGTEFFSVQPGGGPYRVDGLVPGEVKVKFHRQEGFQPNFYPNAGSEEAATPVGLIAGQCTAGIDGLLVPRQVVRGTVRDAISGDGVSGVAVAFGELVTFPFNTTSRSAATVTGAGGNYVLEGLAAASERLLWTINKGIHFGQGYLMHPPNTPVGSWTRFTLAPDQTLANMDFALQKGAHVSGRVLGLYGSTTANSAVYLSPNNSGAFADVSRPLTDGSYEFSAFTPGTYRLIFAPRSQGPYYVFPGLSCAGTGAGTGIPLCEVTGATNFAFTETREYPNLNFDFEPLDRIFRSNFE